LPIGAMSEIVGPECSGRTSLALALVAGMTQAGKVCAWVDVSDTLHPESAAAIGVDLARLLWIRCGASSGKAHLPQASAFRIAEKPPKAKPVLPQGGGGHPRMEVRGLSDAVSDLLTPRCAEALHQPRPEPKQHESPNPAPQNRGEQPTGKKTATPGKSRSKSWSRLEQALRVTDLLLQAGGFSSIVLDMGSLNAEYALRVPLATWFRFRAAAERLQANVLLLTQHACAKSSAALVLRLDPGGVLAQGSTIFTGLEHQAEVARQRSAGKCVPSSQAAAKRAHSAVAGPLGRSPMSGSPMGPDRNEAPDVAFSQGKPLFAKLGQRMAIGESLR